METPVRILLIVLAFPVAYWIAFYGGRRKPTYLFLLLLPFFVSFVLRTISWRQILTDDGPVLHALKSVGLVPDSYHLLGTPVAVIGGLVYNYLPFMVLPIYATLERMDETLLEAAADLGCPRWKAFWLVTAPLALPGVIAGSLLCFIPIVGEFVIPDLLGGSGAMMIGQTLWLEFFNNRDWPAASAVAVVLLALLIVPLVVYQHLQARRLERGA